METSPAAKPLKLRFGGRLVEQLGAQLYPRVTASVAELISNAWDADARHAWVKIPFGSDWTVDAVIEVLDDGVGMTRLQASDNYLIVGRNRRLDGGDESPGGRPLHGRKGIGKLAAFGTAGYLECVTVSHGEVTAFAIDYDELRSHDPDQDYAVKELESYDPLTDPDTGEPLSQGTRVRLTRLKAKRKTPEDSFLRSMERRFALDATQMTVYVNGTPLKRYGAPVDIRFPRDAKPPGVTVTVDDDGWAREVISYPTAANPDETREVRWWIGFTKTPISDEDMQGVSVLARGKLAQRPFTFERASGTTGQLGLQYLVGEVSADWLDHGTQADEDLIQSNRDQLQLDNAELEPFMNWGRERLRWALAQRNEVRREQHVGPGALGQQVEDVLIAAPAGTRERLRTLAGRIADITEADDSALAQAVRAVVEASEVKSVERVAADLSLEGDPDDEVTWQLLKEARETVREGVSALLGARRDALAGFLAALAEPPVLRLHSEVSASPWLVSPLLADVPREILLAEDRFVCIRFARMPPVFDGLTLLCWATDADGPTKSVQGIEPDMSVASSWSEDSPDLITWQQLLHDSSGAHDALIASLEKQT